MVNQQENPSDKHADITLSNGNLTASQSATNQRAHWVPAVTPKINGRTPKINSS